MTELFLTEMTEAFTKYVKAYKSANPDIQLHMDVKEEHTAKVVSHSQELAEFLGLSLEEQQICRLIGLWHDLGRFKQYTLYQTFNDRLSVNHAQLGLEELERLGWLTRLTPKERSWVAFAIGCHNAAKIPDPPTPSHLLFAQVIRDADKLDIFRVLEPTLQPPEATGCSKTILQDLSLGRQTFFENMKTSDDRKLVRLSWIYDVYFSWTMRKIRKEKYVDHIFACLPDTPEIQAISQQLGNYMDQKTQ